MKRVIIHWTGGTNKANATDKEHYHFVVEGDGKIIEGNFKPENNEKCVKGRYAMHTGKGNTGSIGVAMCGMKDFVPNIPKSTKYPLALLQLEACISKVAQLCKKYGIKVTSDTVMTHYEFNRKHLIKTGKIDIVFLHIMPWLKKDEIGDFIRDRIINYRE